MSTLKLNLLNGLLTSIASFHPEYKAAIDTVIKYEPMIDKLAPVAIAGAKEGPGIVAAIKDKAPELLAAIKNLVAASHASTLTDPGQALPGPTQRAQDVHVENVARSLFGLGQMSVEEQTAWMNSKSPISEDSKSGSA